MKILRQIKIILLPAFCLICQVVYAAPISAATKPLYIAATIFPLADITRNITGEAAQVIQILPAGASPHTFDLTPGKVRELQKARIIFKIGVIDEWIDGIAESVPGAEIVSLQNHIALKPFQDDALHRGNTERFDPHYWLDARNGAIMTQNICSRLSALDPLHADLYSKNSQRYQHELLRLDDELKKACAALKNNKIIVFHDGWRYFAAAYGLEIIAVFQPAPGREPTPRDLQKLYVQVRTYKIKAVFSEPQLPTANLEPLLEDLGLRLFILDPLGGAAPDDSYIELLRRNVRTIIQADGL
jgi:zinc transport system substrate-binding protein/manganese/iron transport system substrate-binding protein